MSWESTVPQEAGYAVQLQRLMQCLRYPGQPVFWRRRFVVGDRAEWEARVTIEPRTDVEPEYRFRARYRRDFAESAVQDAAREAFLRLHALHRVELMRTEFAHHPYRGEDDTFCSVQASPCCYNPMVTHLSHWAEAADDSYEEPLLEIDEQQRCLLKLETEITSLTQHRQQLEEEHHAWGNEIDSLMAQLQARDVQYAQLSGQYGTRGDRIATLEAQLQSSQQQVRELEEQLGAATATTTAASTSTAPPPPPPAPVCDHHFDYYCFLTPPYQTAFRTILESAEILGTELAPGLVDPSGEQPAVTVAEPIQAVAAPPSQLGSSEETPIQIDSELEEDTDLGAETEPEEVERGPGITDSSEDQGPGYRMSRPKN